MSTGLKKPPQDGCESPSPEVEQGKINEVKRLLRPQTSQLALYCSDASISRYLRARKWNVKKTVKMLNESLKWRLEYKPEEIHWDDVSLEAETGKIYRSSYKDKYGRPVLVMRPRCQNSKSIKGQVKYLVYCMENAILNLPEDQEQMVWLIDFHGFSLSNISVKVTRETAYVLQEQYPERLGVAILYNAPKIFEPFWMVAKPFLERETANKVKFVYSDDPSTTMIMDDLFNMDVVESAFGGKDEADFDINKYAERMREDEKKIHSLWKTENNLAAVNSDASDVKVGKFSSPRDKDDDSTVDESILVKQQ